MRSLRRRLEDDAATLLTAYRASAAELEGGRGIEPAAEWLLDNYHLVEAQLRQVREDLPPGYYRQLPKLAEGPLAGYPRVLGVAWAYVAHTDSNFEPETLRRFIAAYQSVQTLTIGELWAVAITLRIVLVENLRRLADEISLSRKARKDADELADSLIRAGATPSARDVDAATRYEEPLSDMFAAQLSKRLRDRDPRETPGLQWLQERLAEQGSPADEVVQRAHQRQGASNVSVRNVITSMRLISDMDWADWFESVSLVDACLCEGSAFSEMDFATRDLYRREIQQLARGSTLSEVQVAQATLKAAALAVTAVGSENRERMSDPGYYLIGRGRAALEARIGYAPPWHLRANRAVMRGGIALYVGTILSATAILMWLVADVLDVSGTPAGWLALFLILALFPLTELVTAVLNRMVTWNFGASILPGLDLAGKVTEKYRTVVAVPTLLTGKTDLLEQIERMEVHYLSGAGGDLTYALLTDGLDAETEDVPGDAEILAAGAAKIVALNQKHGPTPGGTSRFLLLHRRRVYNASEGKWMGWERKRGKLHELNRLLRGEQGTSYVPVSGLAQQLPAHARYVLTLDADTRLPRDAAQKLIGKMAHPLNRPRFDAVQRRIVEGHAILQPRVTPSLPLHREGSVYQRLFSSPGGLDPYAAAVSDIYQDLFGEGSYTGKGIYDIDAFEAALSGRVPENAMLSHDLFEGVFARAGLASDIEVIEEFPPRYDVAAKRMHRWTRGDWQLLPWLMGRRAGDAAVPSVGRAKMLDNLRRSVIAPASFLALCAAWVLPMPAALLATLIVVACVAIPSILPSFSFVLARRGAVSVRNRLVLFAQDLHLAGGQILASLTFMADSAWQMTDAIVRTLVRLLFTRRHLLEWTTAAQAARRTRLTMAGFYRMMWQSIGLVLVATVIVLLLQPSSWPLVISFALLWMAAPAGAWWVSRPRALAPELRVSDETALSLRLTARRTWRYYERFVTADDHFLPPDNFQETPQPVVARRTSPTNMGLYLLSVVTARDFGWIGTEQAVNRLEATLATMRGLEKYSGHFFNWYATDDMRALEPAYVSSVDSGNLAGHLTAVAVSCEEWMKDVSAARVRDGLHDTLELAREAVSRVSMPGDESLSALEYALADMDGIVKGRPQIMTPLPVLKRLADKAMAAAQGLATVGVSDPAADVVFWTTALSDTVKAHINDANVFEGQADLLNSRLATVAATARAMALGMDFAFLLDPARKLLSIGYSLTDNRLDTSCYDLLASESRLASFIAIAKGDVPTVHWMRLGRTTTPVGNGSALISWSGSMFEYLMPSLVMHAPVGSLLEQTNRLIVHRQQQYAAASGIPWGLSESSYNARDVGFTYQYGNFGVPGLGLKRGLSEDRVVTPYATALAAMVDPEAAHRNFQRLDGLGALGRYGFYEALDFTPSRLRDDEPVAIVRSYMAHHHGMTIVAIANAVLDGVMRARFHREPMVQACELLLQERVPRDVAVAHPRAEEVHASARPSDAGVTAIRHFEHVPAGPPHTHLLSNGHYTVMLTAAGGGYSRWRDIAVTRWRSDATRDNWGSYVFLRDIERGSVWLSTPPVDPADSSRVRVDFAEDRADFLRQENRLSTLTQVLVSGEDDGEVRRVTVANSGRRAREVELTSYAELVLGAPAADQAHPAFSKMFVVTEFLPEFGALVATRRARSPEDPRIWAAHFVVLEGDAIAPLQYDTDRARFHRRTDGMAPDIIVSGQPLSNTVGTVLDPVFSIRVSVRVAAGTSARVAYWTVVADTREALIDLVDKHQDRNAFERAKTLAWTQAQVQLRHLGVQAEEAAAFQRLSAALLYPDSRFRASSATLTRGAGSQSGLWPYGISGDLPIVLLRIDDEHDMSMVRQLLRAHEYWRMKQLAVDLVIINERASSYLQNLQNAIDTAIRSSQARPSAGKALAQGAVYALRSDLMSTAARDLIQSVANIVLLAHHGSVADQLARIEDASPRVPGNPVLAAPRPEPVAPTLISKLEYFNGLGGFDQDGTEYVIHLEGRLRTPAPWINVISNTNFGFQVSAEGCGYTWAENSRENQLTPWSNDPVMDAPGEAFYIRDEESSELWSPTAAPIRTTGSHRACHGFGYSRFEHRHGEISSSLLQYVPLHDPIKISRLTLVNRSSRRRRLSVTAYAEWVLGPSRQATSRFLVTHMDEKTGALFVRNPWSIEFAGRTAFMDLCGRQNSWTADRREFLGDNGSLDMPAALRGGADPLSSRCGAALDPCAALRCAIDVAPGDSVEVVVLLGQCESGSEAVALLERYRDLNLDEVLEEVKSHWKRVLGTLQVRTPDRGLDIMLNGWLLYQTIACRLWARSGFYQASGAYGFRDQLQDSMALSFAMPEVTRSQLLRAAARQFPEGDVQHWWLPHSGRGVRTHISDDRVWLAYAAAHYVARCGDPGVLDEEVAFLEGPELGEGESDAFFQPSISSESATLYEHCARGLDQCMRLTGAHGLPLIGTGDWNDGMSRVGAAGRGESVWLGWLLMRTLDMFEPLARMRDPVRSARWVAHAAALKTAIEAHAWDGAWYRRATFDNGTWLGSSDSEECQIDSIAQSWAVLSGAARADRATIAMNSLEERLISHEERVARLFAPPFDHIDQDPGYIKGYPPGLRENGGQYTHAALWAVLAYARLGQGARAARLLAMLNPVNHARDLEGVLRYKVEPYVVAADVYAVAPHTGRGGWTWYTGSAGWMYTAGVEGVLGIRRSGSHMIVSPCIPPEWPGFDATLSFGATRYSIRVENASRRGVGVASALLDGAVLSCRDDKAMLPLDGRHHDVRITL